MENYESMYFITKMCIQLRKTYHVFCLSMKIPEWTNVILGNFEDKLCVLVQDPNFFSGLSQCVFNQDIIVKSFTCYKYSYFHKVKRIFDRLSAFIFQLHIYFLLESSIH